VRHVHKDAEPIAGAHEIPAELAQPAVTRLLGGNVADPGLRVVVHELQVHQALRACAIEVGGIAFEEIRAFCREHDRGSVFPEHPVERLG